MATKLTKPVAREVATPAGTNLIVTMTPEGVTYREKRRRTTYLMPHAIAYQHAAMLYVASRMKQRKKTVKRGLLRVGKVLS